MGSDEVSYPFSSPLPPQRQPSLKSPLPHLYLLMKLLVYTSKYPTPRSSLAKKSPTRGRILRQDSLTVDPIMSHCVTLNLMCT